MTRGAVLVRPAAFAEIAASLRRGHRPSPGPHPRHLPVRGDDGRGLLAGLSNENAARYAFLLATPIIGAAAALKLPELFGSTGDGIRGQALVASLCSAATAYLSVRFLLRYFETRTLVPFAVWCLGFVAACSLYFLAT